MGLDVGEKRIGVAVGETEIGIATPYSVIERRGPVNDDVFTVIEIAEKQGVGKLVVGLPLTLSGREGSQARSVRRFVESIRAQTTRAHRSRVGAGSPSLRHSWLCRCGCQSTRASSSQTSCAEAGRRGSRAASASSSCPCLRNGMLPVSSFLPR